MAGRSCCISESCIGHGLGEKQSAQAMTCSVRLSAIVSHATYNSGDAGQSGYFPSGSLDQEGWLGAAMQPHGSLSGGLPAQQRGVSSPCQSASATRNALDRCYVPPHPQPSRGVMRHYQQPQQQLQQLQAQRARNSAEPASHGVQACTMGDCAHHAYGASDWPPQAHPAAFAGSAAPVPPHDMLPTACMPAQRAPAQQSEQQPYQPAWQQYATPASHGIQRLDTSAAPPVQQAQQPYAAGMPYMLQALEPNQQPLQAHSYQPGFVAPDVPPCSDTDAALPPSFGTGRSHQPYGASVAQPLIKSEPDAPEAGTRHLVVRSASAEESPPAAERVQPGASTGPGFDARDGVQLGLGSAAGEGEGQEDMNEVCCSPAVPLVQLMGLDLDVCPSMHELLHVG